MNPIAPAAHLLAGLTGPLRPVRGLATWHLTSVQVARRNALVAGIELAARRRELRDVEAFLARHQEAGGDVLTTSRRSRAPA